MNGDRGSRIFLTALALAVGLAACLGDGASCPAGTALVSVFTVNYTTVNEGDTCIITALPDGGPDNAPLVTAPSTNSFTLCATGQDGGTTTLYLDGTALVPDAGNLLGTIGLQTDVAGSACTCPINVADQIYVNLSTTDGGPLGWSDAGDGGFSPLNNFSGTLDYAFAESSDSTVACTCNLPCGAHYTLSGTH